MRVALKGFHLSLACEPVSRPPAANCIYIEVSKYSLGAFTDRCCSWCSFSSGDSNFVPALDGHKLCCWCSLFVCLFVMRPVLNRIYLLLFQCVRLRQFFNCNILYFCRCGKEFDFEDSRQADCTFQVLNWQHWITANVHCLLLFANDLIQNRFIQKDP